MNRYAVSCNGKECGSIVAASYSAAIAVAFTEINESKVTQMAVVLTDKNIKLKPSQGYPKVTKQTWYDTADVLERFRAFPILMMMGYGVFVWEVFAWIRSLDNVGVQEAGIFGAIIANAGFVFNFYTNLVAKSSKVE